MTIRILFLSFIILLSCNSDTIKRPNKIIGKPKFYWHSLGLMYGPVNKITETSKLENSEVTETYEFSDQYRKLIIASDGIVDAEVYFDNDMIVDSLITFGTGRKIKTIYFKLKLYHNYMSHSIDMGKYKDSTILEFDSARNLVKSYFKGNLYTIDSFDASRFLVRQQSILANSINTYIYDEYGHIKNELVKFLHQPDTYRKSDYRYKYDEYGNWVERIIESDLHDVKYASTFKTKRTIVYN